MNIFEQYGIKEVADVTLYAIELDENDEEIYIPVLYLDTLKISSVEQTAEQTSARGGLGNPHLITWDYGKEITVKLEDALYTPASMSMLWGGKYASKSVELWGVFDAHKEKFSWAKAILKDFSNFSIEEDSNKGTIYKWTVNLIIMSLDGQLRHEKNGIEISYYSKYGRNYWSFNNPVDFEDGSFTLSEGKNLFVNVPQELIYQIKHGIESVKYLDRMEKCVATRNFVIDTDTNIKHGNYRYLKKYDKTALTVFIDPTTMQPYEPNLDFFIRKDGSRYPKEGFKKLRLIKQNDIYYKWTRSVAPPHMSLGNRITVDAEHFPSVYRLVGETYSRNRDTHEDERFQFEIPLCKMGSENSFTFEAAGEPTVFNMTLQVLRREDGTMMKLTQYDVEQDKYDGQTSGSTIVVPIDDPDIIFNDIEIKAEWKSPYELNWGIEEYGDRTDIVGLKIIHPSNLAEFYTDDNIYWATTADMDDGNIENGETLIEGIAGTIRTYLYVQTVDGVVQWENNTPVFVLDDFGNIITKTEELESSDVKFTSDNEFGQNIEVSLETLSSEEEGEG